MPKSTSGKRKERDEGGAGAGGGGVEGNINFKRYEKKSESASTITHPVSKKAKAERHTDASSSAPSSAPLILAASSSSNNSSSKKNANKKKRDGKKEARGKDKTPGQPNPGQEARLKFASENAEDAAARKAAKLVKRKAAENKRLLKIQKRNENKKAKMASA